MVGTITTFITALLTSANLPPVAREYFRKHYPGFFDEAVAWVQATQRDLQW